MGIRMGAGAYYFRKYFSGLMDKNGVWSTQESINEAGLKISEFPLSSLKKQMNIYQDGHIEVNNKTINLNSIGCIETNPYREEYVTNVVKFFLIHHLI